MSRGDYRHSPVVAVRGAPPVGGVQSLTHPEGMPALADRRMTRGTGFQPVTDHENRLHFLTRSMGKMPMPRFSTDC